MFCQTPAVCAPYTRDMVIYQICASCNPTTPPPEYICSWVLGCDDVNKNGIGVVQYLIKICTNETTGAASGPPETFDMSGAPYTPSVPVACSGVHDVEIVSKCYQTTASPPVQYTRLDFVDTSVSPPTVQSTLWQDAAGAISPTPPAGTLVPCVEASNTIKSGAYQSSGAFTQAALPGIAAGGTLQSFTIRNIGNADFRFTGTDGNAVRFPPGHVAAWNVDESQDVMAGWAGDATGTTVIVHYTYR